MIFDGICSIGNLAQQLAGGSHSSTGRGAEVESAGLGFHNHCRPVGSGDLRDLTPSNAEKKCTNIIAVSTSLVR